MKFKIPKIIKIIIFYLQCKSECCNASIEIKENSSEIEIDLDKNDNKVDYKITFV